MHTHRKIVCGMLLRRLVRRLYLPSSLRGQVTMWNLLSNKIYVSESIDSRRLRKQYD